MDQRGPIDDDFEPSDSPKSKSQRKREMHALQDVAKELAGLNKEQLAKVPLDDDLRDALADTQRVRSHEGRRRQMQFLGKQMRRLDNANVAAIRAALETLKGGSKAETARLHRIERLRVSLLVDDVALTAFIAEHPQIDAQALRTLIRNARREASEHRPPKHFRELFQALKNALEHDDRLRATDADAQRFLEDRDAPPDPNTP